MKILYVLPSLANTAPIAVALQLVNACIRVGYSVEVAYFDNIIELEFPCYTFKIKMKDNMDFDRYDIIHSHMRRPDKYVAIHRKSIAKAITVSTIHCDIFDDLKYSYGSFIAYIYTKIWIEKLKKFDYTVQVSQFLMVKYSDYFKNNYLISNGVKLCKQDIGKYTTIKNKIEEYHTNNKYKVILSYSNINKRKGLHQILYALSQKEDLAYICIGNGENLENLKKLTNKLKLKHRVSFFPFVSAPYNLIPYVDVVAITSYSESFCLALHEAGMMGASVICSDIPAFKDVFTENEVCFFELDNSKSFLQAVSNALTCNRAIKLREKELKYFTVEIMQNNYLKLYRSIAKRDSLDD